MAADCVLTPRMAASIAATESEMVPADASS